MQGNTLMYGIILVSSALMAVNILRYMRFERELSRIDGWEKERYILYIPLVLLILFLAGYLAVFFWRKADPIVSAILFGGSVFVFLILNFMWAVTDRVRQNAQLRSQLDSAHQISAAKSAFLSNMSHDIRTPLNAVIGYAALAGREGVTEEQMREYLSGIDTSGRHLLSLIDDILEMSRIENGRMELELAPADFCGIMREIRDLFAPQMAEKGLSFSMDGSRVVHRAVLCDRARLTRVFMNLLSNAYKFTPAGGSVSLTAAEREDDGRRAVYEFRVKDTGIGMSPEFAERIFTAFERERTSTISGIQGTGLGMAITKNFVDLMGGGIRIETAPGKGTEFIVSLPLSHTDKPGACALSDAPEEKRSPRFDGRRILLAEDIAVNREIAAMLLTDAGFEVETAENGREAADKVRLSAPGTFDAVLMDVQMPVMDGYEATRAIRALPDPALARIPILALTANAFSEDRQKVLEAGMNGHVAKPVDPDVLLRSLSELLNA